MIALFETLGADVDNTIIGMDATGHYWISLYSYLLELGYELRVINPICSDGCRKMFVRKVKNDTKDSLIIPQVIRTNEYSSSRLAI